MNSEKAGNPEHTRREKWKELVFGWRMEVSKQIFHQSYLHGLPRPQSLSLVLHRRPQRLPFPQPGPPPFNHFLHFHPPRQLLIPVWAVAVSPALRRPFWSCLQISVLCSKNTAACWLSWPWSCHHRQLPNLLLRFIGRFQCIQRCCERIWVLYLSWSIPKEGKN